MLSHFILVKRLSTALKLTLSEMPLSCAVSELYQGESTPWRAGSVLVKYHILLFRP